MFAIKNSKQRQRLTTNFHRTKTEPHRTGVDLPSPGDVRKLGPAQKVAQGGRGGLPDGVGDPGPETGPSRAVSGPRRVPAGVVHPPKSPTKRDRVATMRRVRRVAGEIFFAEFQGVGREAEILKS